MTDLTCSFLQAVAKEEEVSDENSLKLRRKYFFLCFQTLILTFGVWEFMTVIQTLNCIWGLQNFQEFSQHPECLDKAM